MLGIAEYYLVGFQESTRLGPDCTVGARLHRQAPIGPDCAIAPRSGPDSVRPRQMYQAGIA